MYYYYYCIAEMPENPLPPLSFNIEKDKNILFYNGRIIKNVIINKGDLSILEEIENSPNMHAYEIITEHENELYNIIYLVILINIFNYYHIFIHIKNQKKH